EISSCLRFTNSLTIIWSKKTFLARENGTRYHSLLLTVDSITVPSLKNLIDQLSKKPLRQRYYNNKILFGRILENTLFKTWVKQRLMLDYLTANIAFWMTLFGVQESLLEFRLGYLGRYWFLAISASLLLGFLLSAPITITLIIKFAVDPFTWTDNIILCA
ncbi:MAG: hypothetical protein ACYT04_46800, partial [Nostoc sp.]